MREFISTLEDPRLEPYRQLKDTNATRWAQRFVVEGEKLVERLLASDLKVESLLASEQYAERFADRVAADVPVLVVPAAWIEQIVGFNFHRGILACARRPARRGLEQLPLAGGGPSTLVVCPDVQDPENLGSILRTSAAFGVSAVALGVHSADPFSRRVLRVSMGAALTLPIARPLDLDRALSWLAEEAGFELWATVLDPAAEPLAAAPRSERLALVFGNEAHGLDPRWLAHCRRQVTIPLCPGTDSLNVAVASGIFLYEVTRQSGGRNNSPPA